MIQNAELIAEH